MKLDALKTVQTEPIKNLELGKDSYFVRIICNGNILIV